MHLILCAMHKNIKEILISEEQIIEKCKELGKIIDNNDHILTNARQTMLLQKASQALNQAV